MTIRKSVLLGVTACAFAGVSLAPTVAHASYLSGYGFANSATHLVRAKETVPVIRFTTGTCVATTHTHFYKYLHKGSKVYASGCAQDIGGWVIRSSSIYHAGPRTFYTVPSNHHGWYEKIR